VAIHITFVTPIAPTFSPNVLVPFPLPMSPANTVPSPSNPIPLLIACTGGGGAPDIHTHKSIYLMPRV